MHAVPYHTVHNGLHDNHTHDVLKGKVKILSDVLKNTFHPPLSEQKVPIESNLHLSDGDGTQVDGDSVGGVDDGTQVDDFLLDAGRTDDDPDDGVIYLHFRALRKNPLFVERNSEKSKRNSVFSVFYHKMERSFTLGERLQHTPENKSFENENSEKSSAEKTNSKAKNCTHKCNSSKNMYTLGTIDNDTDVRDSDDDSMMMFRLNSTVFNSLGHGLSERVCYSLITVVNMVVTLSCVCLMMNPGTSNNRVPPQRAPTMEPGYTFAMWQRDIF
jgi:hypothetical protein